MPEDDSPVPHRGCGGPSRPLVWSQMGAAGRMLAPPLFLPQRVGPAGSWEEGAQEGSPPARPPGQQGRVPGSRQSQDGVSRVGVSAGPASSLLLCQGAMVPGLGCSGCARLDWEEGNQPCRSRGLAWCGLQNELGRKRGERLLAKRRVLL